LHLIQVMLAQEEWLYIPSVTEPPNSFKEVLFMSMVSQRSAAVVVATLVILFVSSLASTSAAVGARAHAAELVVYTYDSFVSWGPAEAIEAGFESAHPGVDVVFVAPGSSG